MRKVKVTKGATPLYHQKPSGALHDGFQVEKQPEPTINNVAKEVDKDEANVEAEKGEVVYSPSNPQLKLINGKSHKKGGTLLNLDQGDFVFSHYLKMGGEEQQIIGVEPKENVSYADALKQNVKPFNKAVHLMNTSEDMYDKNTATFTLKESLKKIEQLALMQELKKGMPNGTPAFMEQPDAEPPMAKYGGMQYLQAGGRKKPELTVERREKAKLLKQARTDRKADYTESNVDYWIDQKSGKGAKPISGGKFTDADRRAIIGKLQKGQITLDQLPKFVGKNKVKEYEKYYKPAQGSENVEYFVRPEDKPNTVPTETPKGTNGTTPVGGGQTTKKDDLIPGDSGEIYYNDERDLGYGLMDAASMAAPLLMRNRKYASINQRVQPQTIGPRLVDFEAQRQSMKGMASTLGRQNNLTGTSSMNSSRNSELLGKVLNPINESFQNEFNTNQGIMQQVDGVNMQAINNAKLQNNQYDDVYNTRYAQMNENFDAVNNLKFKNFMEAWQGAETGRLQKTYSNMITPDYSIDENGNIDRKATDAKRALARIKAGKKQGSSETFEQWYRKNGMDKINGMNPDRAINAWAKINSTES